MDKSKAIAAGITAVIFMAPVLLFFWMTATPGRSFSGTLPPLTAEQSGLAVRLRTHVTAIGSKPHNMEHPAALEEAAQYLERQLHSLGYLVHRQQVLAGTRNLEVVVEPLEPSASTLIVGAHYDSAYDAPGANDNGTGTAAVLELARSLANVRGKAPVRVRLVLFVNEEPPHFQREGMGSLTYARALRRSGERVDGMLSLETMGYYSDAPGSQLYPFPLSLRYPDNGNFIAFVANLHSRPLERRALASFRKRAAFPSIGGAAPAFVQGIDWSDHWAFEQNGFNAIMVTDTAPFRYPYYHSPSDTPGKVDYARLSRVVRGLDAVIRTWQSDS
ncbi:MAG: M28 family peptidase [Sphingomicrobium sp.]